MRPHLFLPPLEKLEKFAELTTHLYETARQCRLGTETFGLDGRHSGTGGGNHITLEAIATPGKENA